MSHAVLVRARSRLRVAPVVATALLLAAPALSQSRREALAPQGIPPRLAVSPTPMALEGNLGDMEDGTVPASAGRSPGQSARERAGVPGPDGAAGIYGLRPRAGGPRTIAFAEAMGLTLNNQYDIRMAQERLVQTQLLVRKAWALVLPRLEARGGYTFSWPEVRFRSVSQGTLDEQAAQRRNDLDQQAQRYDAQADAARTDGDTASEAADRRLAAETRAQRDGVESQRAPHSTTIVPNHLVRGGLQMSVVVFNGRALPLLLNAYDTVKQMHATLDYQRTQMLYLAALNYYNAAAAHRLAEIAQQQVRNLEQHLQSTRARVEARALPALALHRAEVDVTRATAGLHTAQDAYQAALGSLGLMMGVEDAFELGALPPVPALEEQSKAEDLLALALRGRQDLKAARLAVDVAERERLDALARFLPVVSVNGDAFATSNLGFSRYPVGYSVTLDASVPLYDAGERYTAWREATSHVRQAHITLEDTQRRVQMSIQGNLRELDLRKVNLEHQRRSLALAESVVQDARARFDLGAATNLEVLDAEQLLVGAQMDLAQAEIDLQMSRLALAWVVGSFDPALEEGRGGAPSPVRGLPGAPARAEAGAPTAPALAPAGRAGTAAVSSSRLSLVPSAMELVGAGLAPAR